MADDKQTDLEMQDWEEAPETTDMESNLTPYSHVGGRAADKRQCSHVEDSVLQSEENPHKFYEFDASLEVKIIDEEGFMIFPNNPKEPEKPPEVHFMNWQPNISGSKLVVEVSDGRRITHGISKSKFRILLPHTVSTAPQPDEDSMQTDTSEKNNPGNVPVPDPSDSSEEKMQE